MKNFILCIISILFLAGCAAKQPEEKIIYVEKEFIECPAPEKPTLKLLPKGHIGSKKVISVILENFNVLELYSNQLENTVECYQKQVTKPIEEEK